MKLTLSTGLLVLLGVILGTRSDIVPGTDTNSIYVGPESSEEQRTVPEIPTNFNAGATLRKNRVKGPADMGIYYINSPGASCGGLSTGLCSKNCGALGYPVYWCYPKVCYCHYG